jgi:hypothetical protein
MQEANRGAAFPRANALPGARRMQEHPGREEKSVRAVPIKGIYGKTPPSDAAPGRMWERFFWRYPTACSAAPSNMK